MQADSASTRAERAAAAAAGLASLAVYCWTLAPGLSSGDGGELLTAAANFGVPHPSGYPLWALLTWAFTRLPVAGVAWLANLLSALFAAAAAAGLGYLATSFLRRLDCPAAPSVVIGAAAALTVALSPPVWSQAVITEVYSLHLLLGVLVLAALYRWLRKPDWSHGFVAAVGAVSLGLSNHHLILALAPLPVIVLLMIRPRGWPELLGGTVLVSAVLLRLWAGLSEAPAMITLGQRVLEAAVVAAAAVLVLRRRPAAWLGCLRVAAVMVLGLLVYAYLPIAAATDPPLCWDCPRDAPAFFHLTNRSSYWGSHATSLFRIAGEPLGLEPPEWARPGDSTASFSERLALSRWLAGEAVRSVSLPMIGFALLGLVAAPRMRRQQRRWVDLLVIATVSAGWLLPAATGLGAGLRYQRLMRPYLGLAVATLALLGVCGAGWLAVELRRRLGPRGPWAVAAVAVAGLLIVASSSAALSSRRGNHLTEDLMTELLEPLPSDSMVLASTDTVFFAATAMVEVAELAEGSGLTRSRLAIITPARLANGYYFSEVHRSFGENRPQSRWSRWRRRRPVEPVALPPGALRDSLVASRRDPGGGADIPAVNSELARLLFELNRDYRPVFIELEAAFGWALPHARPDGPWLRLEPEPIERLEEVEVAADLAFWDSLLDEMSRSPGWAADEDLRSSVADLRLGFVRVYRFRGLREAAERACRQAIAAAPDSEEAVLLLADVLDDRGLSVQRREMLAEALRRDPHSRRLRAAAGTQE